MKKLTKSVRSFTFFMLVLYVNRYNFKIDRNSHNNRCYSKVRKKTVTCGVESVYSNGLIAELIGRANTAIHTARSPGGSNVFSTWERMPIEMIGIQHKKSVRIMKNTLLASALSLLVCAFCALARISRMVPCLPSRLLDDHDFRKMAT